MKSRRVAGGLAIGPALVSALMSNCLSDHNYRDTIEWRQWRSPAEKIKKAGTAGSSELNVTVSRVRSGMSVLVGERLGSAADGRLATPAAVLAWIMHSRDRRSFEVPVGAL